MLRLSCRRAVQRHYEDPMQSRNYPKDDGRANYSMAVRIATYCPVKCRSGNLSIAWSRNLSMLSEFRSIVPCESSESSSFPRTRNSQAGRKPYPPSHSRYHAHNHNPATSFPNSRPNRDRQWIWRRIKRICDDRTTRPSCSRARRNRGAGCKLQSYPEKIRTRARRIFCDHARKRPKRIWRLSAAALDASWCSSPRTRHSPGGVRVSASATPPDTKKPGHLSGLFVSPVMAPMAMVVPAVAGVGIGTVIGLGWAIVSWTVATVVSRSVIRSQRAISAGRETKSESWAEAARLLSAVRSPYWRPPLPRLQDCQGLHFGGCRPGLLAHRSRFSMTFSWLGRVAGFWSFELRGSLVSLLMSVLRSSHLNSLRHPVNR